MKTQDAVLLAALGFGVWFLLKSRTAAAAGGAPSTRANPRPVTWTPSSPGSAATTASQASVTAAVWKNLTATTGPSSGYVNFPLANGGTTQAAAAFLPWATDNAGNYYTQWDGLIYYITGVPDDSGNYPAILLGS